MSFEGKEGIQSAFKAYRCASLLTHLLLFIHCITDPLINKRLHVNALYIPRLEA